MPNHGCQKDGHIKKRRKDGSNQCVTCARDRRREYKEREKILRGRPAPHKREAVLDEETIQAWQDLREAEPELFFQALLVRFMLEQRGFSIRSDLPPITGMSRSQLYKAVNPKFIRADGSAFKNNTITVSAARQVLDTMEDAITTLTEGRHGVYSITGATDELRSAFSEVVDQGRRDILINDSEEQAY
jgi:hypothetical protein